MLRIAGLRVAYGNLEVLHGISLMVRQGEIVALLGANGAGKTTTISAVSGLLRISSGSIEFEGRDITNAAPDRIVSLGLVQVPEGRRIFPKLTVLENLEMGAYQVRDKRAKKKAIERAFVLFPRLAERSKQLGGTLSGGEQQMLAIARGLMSEPKMLLLDEPSLGLAPMVVDRIFEIIQEIRRSGTTILLVEQNAQRGLEIADRGYILETGRVSMEDKGRALLKNPDVQARYLGA